VPSHSLPNKLSHIALVSGAARSVLRTPSDACHARHRDAPEAANSTACRAWAGMGGHVRACAGMCRYGWQARLHVGCDGAEATGVQTRT